MSDRRMFSSEAIEAYAAEARAAYGKHKSLTTPGFQRDMLIATAKLAVEAARNFTNRQLAERDAKIDDLTHKCAKQALTVDSLERRASRQAEHLKTLEERVQKLMHR